VLAFVALALPGCTGGERPEGIVERWLLSLNQGAAGRPERYASDDLSERILPDHREAEPGELDVIEVGTAEIDEAAASARVRIHVERLDGTEIDAAVRIERPDGGEGWFIEGLEEPGSAPPLASEGGPKIGGIDIAAWLAAVGVAALLTLGSAALMATVPGPRGKSRP
jgi:hypothetical protein